MTRIRFEWDKAKSRSNQRKHGVSFEEAGQVFRDPFHASVLDKVVNGEERWQTLGLVGGVLLLLAAHTVEEESTTEEVIRIISARRATMKKGAAMKTKTKTTSYTLDTLPPLTAVQRSRLKALAADPESEINRSEIRR